MKQERNLGGLDRAKLIAALLVVAIHTSPLASFSANADFIFTRVLARTAVPFFLMTTGYFLLPQYLFKKSMDVRPFCHSAKKLLLLYAMAIVLYLPVNFYAGHVQNADAADILRMIVFDGTFYHLWYLPAAILGILLVSLAGCKLPFKALAGLCLTLYLPGLLGDSYYGFIAHSPAGLFYQSMFSVFSYTRNGLFYAPVFLVMGAGLSQLQRKRTPLLPFIGLAASLSLMVLEGLTLRRLGVQRHDSMYFMLLPCMFFLFQLAASWDKPPAKRLRGLSTWIYILHPLSIIAVRGAARGIGLETLLVENSLAHYLAVCLLSAAAAAILERLFRAPSKQNVHTGRAWIELDLQSLDQNIDALRRLLPPGSRLMPAVKADAYGHGAVPVSKALEERGVTSFCVASVSEGMTLRQNGITGEILILGYTHPSQFSLLRKYRLTQTVIDYPYAKRLNACGKKIRVHLKIDTGMHRLGERYEHLDEIFRIFSLKHLLIDGIYTHLSVSDSLTASAQAFTGRQAECFYETVGKLRKRLSAEQNRRLKTHLLASYGLLHYPGLAGDYVRTGIALYGLLSSREDEKNCPIPLSPVLSVKTRISTVKDLFSGEAAGYGLRYIAEQDRKIAVLSIGYADGIPRSLSCGAGKVLVKGYAAPIIGNICMDQTLIDVTDIPKVKQGDIAVIIGKSGKLEITAYDLAEQTGTITNELLSRLGSRLERTVAGNPPLNRKPPALHKFKNKFIDTPHNKL